MQLTDLARYLDSYLEVDRVRDYAPNGLQVEGRPEVEKIVTGVSGNLEFFEKAIDAGADAVLVHHGMFWKNEPRTVVGARRKRIKLLLDHDVSVLAYHLPLDRHAEVGNNAVALRDLGAEDLEPWGLADGTPIGFKARFPQPVDVASFFDRLYHYYRQRPVTYAYGPARVETVALVSGGGQNWARDAIEEGLDAFVTGEVSEWVMHAAKEGDLHFASCGHYATERIGPKALGAHLQEKFGLDVQFVDVPNPV